MKIALLTFRYPFPPNRGDRITAAGLLRVAGPHHEFDVLALCQRLPDADSVRSMRELVASEQAVRLSSARSMFQMGLGLFGRQPLQFSYFHSRAFERAVRALDARGPYDCVMAHSVRMYPAAKLLRSRRRILMAVDCLSMAMQRGAAAIRGPLGWLYAEESRRLRAAEAEAASWADEVWLVAGEDAKYYPTDPRKVRVVPLGIFSPLDPLVEWQPDGRTLLFVGRLDVRHNVAAARRLCREVLPLVRQHAPQARARLVGSGPSRAIRDLARLPGVELAGRVEDLQAEYSRAAVMVVPLTFSSGMQNKILEAAAAGVPVVTTTYGALGLGTDLGSLLGVADSNEAMAAAVLDVLQNPEKHRERAARAKQAAWTGFRWEKHLEALENPLV